MMKQIQDRDFKKVLIERLKAAPDSIETIRPGEWSRAYAIRRNGEELVVRFSLYRDDFEKDRAAANWSSEQLPIPPVLELGEAIGVAYAVTPRVRGEFLETVTNDRTRAVLPSIFAALDAAREVDLSSAKGFGLWTVDAGGLYPTWREALLTVGESVPPGRLPDWREGLESSPTGMGPFNEAYELMREIVKVCPEERHPIHNDLMNRVTTSVSATRGSASVATLTPEAGVGRPPTREDMRGNQPPGGMDTSRAQTVVGSTTAKEWWLAARERSLSESRAYTDEQLAGMTGSQAKQTSEGIPSL